MNGLNPNYVLGAIVAVVLAALGAILFVLSNHEPEATQTVQVGLLTAVVVPVVTSLFALFNSARARDSANGAHQALGDTNDELEAAQARIAFLETKAGVPSPPRPSQEKTT